MAFIKISKATWDDVIAEEKKLRAEFAKAVVYDREELKLSYRKIAKKRYISYEKARKLVEEARQQDASVAA